MALDRFEGPAEVYVDGRLLANARTARLSIRSGNTQVVTMLRGMAGRSRGPRMVEGSISSAVPVAGLDVDAVQKIVDDADIRVVFVNAGRRIQSDGWIDNVELSRDAQGAAEFSFDFVGGAPKLL